jgi:hypothetical protein
MVFLIVVATCFGPFDRHLSITQTLNFKYMQCILLRITFAAPASSKTLFLMLYNNLRTKVLKYSANIYFNRQCLNKKLIPNYAKINLPYTYRAIKIAQHKIQSLRLKDEFKYTCIKKEELSNELYNISAT